MLTDRLAQVCQEKDETDASHRQLQDTLQMKDNDILKLQEQWKKEKNFLESELKTAEEKVWFHLIWYHSLGCR